MRATPDKGNIYYLARHQTGWTQEYWASLLCVSVEAVRQYETGRIMPADDVVLRMAELSGLQILPMWHLRRKSNVASVVLPEVERLPLAQAVVQFLAQLHRFEAKHHDDALIEIAEDGRVSPDEEVRFNEIVRDLYPLIQAALQIDYAQKEG